MSPRVRVDTRDGLITLNIQNAVPEDSGVYRILVRNPFSDITSQCTLQVYETIKPTDTAVAPIFATSIKGMSHNVILKTIYIICLSFYVIAEFEVSSNCLFQTTNFEYTRNGLLEFYTNMYW